MTDGDRGRLLELHAGWVEANGTGDIGWLRAHLGPGGREDFVMWNTMGSNFFGVKAVVALWKDLSAMAPPQKVVSESWDERVHLNGDLGYVTCMCRLVVDFGPEGARTGGNVDQTFRATEIYERRDGDWKMIHYHGSPHLPGLMGGE